MVKKTTNTRKKRHTVSNVQKVVEWSGIEKNSTWKRQRSESFYYQQKRSRREKKLVLFPFLANTFRCVNTQRLNYVRIHAIFTYFFHFLLIYCFGGFVLDFVSSMRCIPRGSILLLTINKSKEKFLWVFGRLVQWKKIFAERDKELSGAVVLWWSESYVEWLAQFSFRVVAPYLQRCDSNQTKLNFLTIQTHKRSDIKDSVNWRNNKWPNGKIYLSIWLILSRTEGKCDYNKWDLRSCAYFWTVFEIWQILKRKIYCCHLLGRRLHCLMAATVLVGKNSNLTQEMWTFCWFS